MCSRYGLESCSDQLQGIQSGRRTLAEVIAEQDKFIAEVAEQYHAAAAANGRREHENSQGTQDFVTAAVKIDTPCPQGVQGQSGVIVPIAQGIVVNVCQEKSSFFVKIKLKINIKYHDKGKSWGRAA